MLGYNFYKSRKCCISKLSLNKYMFYKNKYYIVKDVVQIKFPRSDHFCSKTFTCNLQWWEWFASLLPNPIPGGDQFNLLNAPSSQRFLLGQMTFSPLTDVLPSMSEFLTRLYLICSHYKVSSRSTSYTISFSVPTPGHYS